MILKCEFCKKEHSSFRSLSAHLHHTHNITPKEYYDKFYKEEGEGICPVCGKETPFYSLREGYQTCCSNKCSNKLPEKIKKISDKIKSHTPEEKRKSYEKLKETRAKNHPDDPTCGEFGSKKHKEAMIDRYGDANYSNKEKAKQTCLDRYGVSCNLQLPEIKEKNSSKEAREKAIQTGRQTCIEKYGVDHPMRVKEFAEDMAKIRKDKSDEFEKNNNCTSYSNMIKQYGQGWKQLNLPHLTFNSQNYIDNKYLPQIIKYFCTPNKSKFEKEVYDCISSLYNKEIRKNVRNKIKNKEGHPAELDIYLPDINLAIECNGDYWHSDEVKFDKYYHQYKTEQCRSAGINLLHIFEFEWNKHQDKIKHIIKECIDGTFENIIYRKGHTFMGDNSYPIFNYKKILNITEPTFISTDTGFLTYNCGYVLYQI